jgi:hypothetical protein
VAPIYSALSIPEEVVAALSGSGCYAVALGDEHLELLNFDAIGVSRDLLNSVVSCRLTEQGFFWSMRTRHLPVVIEQYQHGVYIVEV